jgi:tetratricopeptide (TPR) repeat protein
VLVLSGWTASPAGVSAGCTNHHEQSRSVDDYAHAAQLDPTNPQPLYDRGVAHVSNHQPLLAMDDFDQALKLKPDFTPALMLRGEMRLLERDQPGAKSDFDAAIAGDPSLRLRVAGAYLSAGAFQPAIDNLDVWIAHAPHNEDLAAPLGNRCWAKAVLGQDLDKAMGDCNQALGLRPGLPRAYDGRALIHLRQGDFDRAIADFDAALKLEPHTPLSIYARGLAEQRKGLKDQGDADLAAAVAMAPHIADMAKRFALTP